MRLIVAGIGTEIGKTLVSAIACRAFEADYWKPVQAGELDNSDSHKVAMLSGAKTWPEGYRFQAAMSPDAAAAREQTTIEIAKLQPPEPPQRLVIEFAGGLMVPLSPTLLNIDLIESLACPVLLVSRYYLGSINHTLLSIELLRQRGIPLAGLVFNGKSNTASRDAITARCEAPVWLELPDLDSIDSNTVDHYAENLRQHRTMA